MTSQTVRLTVAQAVVTYLSRQYSVADGQRRRLVPATLGIFGHGNVAGLGQALDLVHDRRAQLRPVLRTFVSFASFCSIFFVFLCFILSK